MSDAGLLKKENVFLKHQLKTKDTHIVHLEELIKQFQRKQFSSSSEKVPPTQLGLFNEAESLLSHKVKKQVPSRLGFRTSFYLLRPWSRPESRGNGLFKLYSCL